MNICKLAFEVLRERKVCLDWCADQGLFTKEKSCDICGSVMTYDYDHGVLGRHRCQKISKHKKARKGVIEVNASDNTLFFQARLPIEQILLITMCWADMFSYEQTMKHGTFLSDGKLSSETVSDWFSYFRDITMIFLNEYYIDKINFQNPDQGTIGSFLKAN